MGVRPAARLPELRRRDVGAAGSRRVDRPRRAALAPDLAGAAMTTETPETPVTVGEPVLRWSARAHSIAEVESELARIWAAQDLTVTEDGETGRHIAART